MKLTPMEEFAARLNELCDDKKLPLRGRAELVSKKFKVTREAARKWLKGLGYPTTAKLIEISRWGNCTQEWLATGRGAKQTVTAELTAYQRAALTYLGKMSLEEQALAVRVLAQLADPHGLGEAAGEPHPTASLGAPVLHDGPPLPPLYRGGGKAGSDR